LTFVPCSWLDGKHTVFGEVKASSPDPNPKKYLDLLEATGSDNGKPKTTVTIVDSGVV
jgi:cyclophilin family peptidyl-prolyl cis-trans isomerase